MIAAILKTTEMGTVPPNINVANNWGEIVIYDEEDDRYVIGEHILLDDDEGVIMAWLKSFTWVWMQKPGTPAMLQQFEQWHF